MKANNVPLGFSWERGRAVFRCSRCPAELALMKPTHHMAPDTAALLARRKGWVASPVNAAHTLCPDCHRKPKTQNDPDSEIRNFTPKEMPPMTEKPDPQPTTDQRVAIRNLLDKHFDDSAHRYLDGWTDEKVAQAVKVPRVVVERIREVGYGPWVKEDPEITAIKAMIARIETDLAATKARLAKAIG